ncbi:MAG: RNA-binding protein [Candidatus Krumholzibacteriota bacterium]|nr:RNA-binding protein [Candidatus Krumholzibacteriota bacterium]
MRIDLVLKYLCLARSRSLVKSWCENDLVTINGAVARASASVRPGDHVAIRHPSRTLTIELRDVPARQVSKARALDYYVEVDSGAA